MGIQTISDRMLRVGSGNCRSSFRPARQSDHTVSGMRVTSATVLIEDRSRECLSSQFKRKARTSEKPEKCQAPGFETWVHEVIITARVTGSVFKDVFIYGFTSGPAAAGSFQHLVRKGISSLPLNQNAPQAEANGRVNLCPLRFAG